MIAEDKNGKAPTWIYSSNECYSGACGTLGAYSKPPSKMSRVVDLC